jgi:hypothetical protein
MGLWGPFWAILLYSGPLSPIQGSVGLQSSREKHPLAASRRATPGAGCGDAGSRGGWMSGGGGDEGGGVVVSAVPMLGSPDVRLDDDLHAAGAAPLGSA